MGVCVRIQSGADGDDGDGDGDGDGIADSYSDHGTRSTLTSRFATSTSASKFYSIITAKVQRDLLESQKKYSNNKYCKDNDFKKCSKDKHILRR